MLLHLYSSSLEAGSHAAACRIGAAGVSPLKCTCAAGYLAWLKAKRLGARGPRSSNPPPHPAHHECHQSKMSSHRKLSCPHTCSWVSSEYSTTDSSPPRVANTPTCGPLASWDGLKLKPHAIGRPTIKAVRQGLLHLLLLSSMRGACCTSAPLQLLHSTALPHMHMHPPQQTPPFPARGPWPQPWLQPLPLCTEMTHVQVNVRMCVCPVSKETDTEGADASDSQQVNRSNQCRPC